MNTRVMFYLTNKDNRYRINKMISINGGTWNKPIPISKYFNSKEDAISEILRLSRQPEYKHTHIVFEPY